MPRQKAVFCLPASAEPLCARLAGTSTPTTRSASASASATTPLPAATAAAPTAPAAPALWPMLPQPRSPGLNGSQWAAEDDRNAARVANFVAHYMALGAAGVLLYGDSYTREALSRHPALRRHAGSLLLVPWRGRERAAYNHDYTLMSSHALLGLSGCGTGVQLLMVDIDEFLYSVHGHGWPAMHECLARAAAPSLQQQQPHGAHATTSEGGAAISEDLTDAAGTAGGGAAAAAGVGVVEEGQAGVESGKKGQPQAPPAQPQLSIYGHAVPVRPGPLGLYSIFRVDITSSRVTPEDEAARWAVAARSKAMHPLLAYDRIALDAHGPNRNKVLAVPASRLVKFFVHEAWPLHGAFVAGSPSCAFILHVVNYWAPRILRNDTRRYEPFQLRLPYYRRQAGATGGTLARASAGGVKLQAEVDGSQRQWCQSEDGLTKGGKVKGTSEAGAQSGSRYPLCRGQGWRQRRGQTRTWGKK
ncbi:hypothetical protein HYH03_013387 [Edaphochlamys debaryana]|uniref:Glycosyltransferase family 92 protein n=1 Tax=Edaphochlamys debaryana TaxID=47281 RepID=A0A835XQX6_9CHLO|nr:hypothetical protein HYH03_013387 [Edaphochlamys debaryana]|eukprot:KAG2488084.1 hypothetical protein HYH03_013387 [Edaphochlamys debaryana]